VRENSVKKIELENLTLAKNDLELRALELESKIFSLKTLI